jgi:hypothetical protein
LFHLKPIIPVLSYLIAPFTSVDAGDIYTITNSDPLAWTALAVSNNGAVQIAASEQEAEIPGEIWHSIDSGGTWTKATTFVDENYRSLAMNADGTQVWTL